MKYSERGFLLKTEIPLIKLEHRFVNARLYGHPYGILVTSNQNIVYKSLELFERRCFAGIDTIFVDNTECIEYGILLNQKKTHYYRLYDKFSDDLRGGTFHPNASGKMSIKILSERYIILLKNTSLTESWSHAILGSSIYWHIMHKIDENGVSQLEI